MVPRPILSKVKSPEALKRLLRKTANTSKGASKSSKKSQIVFTNGVFDLLHRGHVTYLQQARKLGTLLVVALNGDDSVKRLKGPKRPLNTLSDRLVVMAALESVDYVTWFDSDTPLELIQLLKPDVLVKGGDYKLQEIVGYADVTNRGGKVKSLSFIDGHSTTKTIEKF